MTDREKRRAPISYRPPKGREAEFDARVAESGLPVNAFITQRVFGNQRRNAEKAELARLLAEAARINDRLHEAALSGAEANTLLLESCQDELHGIRNALMSLMGRKP